MTVERRKSPSLSLSATSPPSRYAKGEKDYETILKQVQDDVVQDDAKRRARRDDG